MMPNTSAVSVLACDAGRWQAVTTAALSPIGGTFALAYNGAFTGPLPSNATDDAVQAALEALPDVVTAFVRRGSPDAFGGLTWVVNLQSVTVRDAATGAPLALYAEGALLTGRAFYFGGYEGNSVVSWVAITDDGATVELKPPTPCAPLPDDDGSGPPPDDDHPRALRLREEQRGCLIKFKIQPVRSDGDEGHTEASRPTAELGAAPEVAWPQ